jgi:chromosomal replication initiation ATPase DnaA
LPDDDKGADMNKTNDVFERVMARLKAQVGQEVFTSWFGRLKLQSASKSVVRLSVPTAFLKSWINNKYLDQISALYREEAPDVLKIEIMVRSATRSVRCFLRQGRRQIRPALPKRQPAHRQCARSRIFRSRGPALARNFDLCKGAASSQRRDRISA